MASKGQMNGMRGVYLAAAELARLGYIASPTSRSAAGADILATNHDCNHAFSVQVKTKTTKDPYFMLGAKARTIKAKSHVYVLVHIMETKNEGEKIDYYVVPASTVAKIAVNANPNWTNGCLLDIRKIQKFKSGWNIFGESGYSQPIKRAIGRATKH